MNKLMMLTCVTAMTGGLFAESNASAVPSPKEVATDPAVEEMLLGDDGVSIVTAPDGSFYIFSLGTGVYNFNHPKALKDARTVARSTAQKHFAEFIKTKVTGSTTVDDISKDSLMLDGDGKVQNQNATKESLESVKTFIESHTEAVLNGLVVVESKRKAEEGTTAGEIQVKMVYSSKTARASTRMGKQLQNHQAELKINEAKNEARVNAVRAEANAAGAQKAAAEAPAAMGAEARSVGATATAPKWSAADANKSERRVNKTEY